MGELIVNGIKVAFWIAVALVFVTAILNLLNLITSIVFGNIVGEVLGIISMCLPFDASKVFGTIGLACSSILAFLIAKKIYEYSTSNNPLTS